MKKLISICTVALGILCATSCSTKQKGIYFTPSELSVAVGQTKTVTFKAYAEETGYGQFDAEYDETKFVVKKGLTDGLLDITGVSASTSDLVMYCSTDTSLRGTLRVVVTGAN